MTIQGVVVSLEYAILGFLATGPMTGYELKTRCLAPGPETLWTADQAQIYRTLERLAATRLVKATRERQSGKPDRKVYRITDQGVVALTSWLSEAHDSPPARDAFLLQVMLSSIVPDDVLFDVFSARRASRQQRLEELRAAIARLGRDSRALDRASVLHRLALEGEAAAHRAAIDWTDDCLDVLRRGLPGSGATDDGQRQLFPVSTASKKG